MPSRHTQFSVDFTTNIAESNFRYTQVMTVMMLMTANKSIMGRFEIHGYLKYVGWIATAVMAAASAVMFISAFIGGST